MNLDVECLVLTTEVRSAGRCRLAKVRSAWRCMHGLVPSLSFAPRWLHDFSRCGHRIPFSNSSPCALRRFSTVRLAARHVCNTRRDLGKRAPKRVAEIYSARAIKSRENRISLFTLSFPQIYRFCHLSIDGVRRPESEIAPTFRRFSTFSGELAASSPALFRGRSSPPG
jgi:hypothetical protein